MPAYCDGIAQDPVLGFSTRSPRSSVLVTTPDDIAPLIGSGIALRPIGGGNDDAPRLSAVAAALPYSGALTLLPGTYQILTPWLMPSGTTIVMSQGTVINCNLGTGSVTTSAFFVGTNPVGGAHLPVVGSNTPGSKSITVTGVVTVGQVVSLTNANGFFGSTYVVKVATPSGGNTVLTVERPIIYQFRASNSDYAIISTPTALCPTGRMENTRIYGNGAQVTGVGSCVVELFGAVRCEIRGLNCSGNFVQTIIHDNSLFCLVEDCESTVAIGASGAHYFIEGEGNIHRRNRAMGGTGNGYAFQSAVLSEIDACQATDCTAGFMVSNEGAPGALDKYSEGYGNRVIGGAATGCGVGAQVQRGALDTSFLGTVFKYNSTGVRLYGVNGSDPASARTQLIGCDVSDNSGYALQQDSDVTGTVVRGMTASRNGSAILWNGYMDVSGLVVGDTTGNSGAVIQFGANAAGTLEGFEIHANTGSTVALQAIGATIDVRATRGKIFLEGASNVGLLQTTASVVAIDNVDVVQTGTAGTGISSTGTCVTRIGSNVDVDGCTTPLSMTGQTSRGTVVANGATGVDVLFADLKSTDRVRLTLKTVGGTPGRPPSVAYTSGSKFTTTSIAGDTSTYEYVVE